MRRADVAMYEAKREQSGVAVYRADIDPNSRERLVLLDELRDAIEHRELSLHYQPTLDLRTGKIRGVEALARWHHPTLGLLYPDTFIPMAERYGLMPQLTRAVLDLAVAEAVRLDATGQCLTMSVNISRHDLVDEHLADYVDEVLERYGFPSERLTLEVTESALGGDPDRAERCVRALRARGLHMSIDDFGVGYSSMSQLLGLAIDELKIDKSFVLSLASDPRAQAIVRSAIEVARALGLTVVAEGIECEEVLHSLQGIGADVGQGYVIAYPLTSPQLDEYLAHPERCPRTASRLPRGSHRRLKRNTGRDGARPGVCARWFFPVRIAVAFSHGEGDPFGIGRPCRSCAWATGGCRAVTEEPVRRYPHPLDDPQRRRLAGWP